MYDIKQRVAYVDASGTLKQKVSTIVAGLNKSDADDTLDHMRAAAGENMTIVIFAEKK